MKTDKQEKVRQYLFYIHCYDNNIFMIIDGYHLNKESIKQRIKNFEAYFITRHVLFEKNIYYKYSIKNN